MHRLLCRAVLVRIAVLCLFGVVSAVAADDAGFAFVQLCDPQLGVTDYKENIGSLEQAVKQIDALSPEFVLLCGDCVEKPNETSLADFRKIMDALTVPCRFVPGNHDLTLLKPGDALPRYRELFGRDYYTFAQGRFEFFVLNTEILKIPLQGEAEAELSWLRGELERGRQAGAVPILVGHQPPFHRDPAEADAWQGLPAAPRQTLLSLCDQYHVPTYLSGHTHHFVQNRYGATELVSGESAAMNTDGHALGFRLWRVQGAAPWQSTFVPLYKRAQLVPKPAYDSSVETGSAAVCVANLRLLDAAKEAVGMQRQLSNGVVVAEAEVSAVLAGGLASLVCPDGGQYRLNPLGTDPQCSHPGHQLPYFYRLQEFQNRCKAQGELRSKMVPTRAEPAREGK